MRPYMVTEHRHHRLHVVLGPIAPLSLLAGSLVLSAVPASADVTDGLVVRYDLDQSSGTTATDTSGNGRDGVLSGDASWSSGGGLALGGTNGYLRLPNNVLAGLGQITVAADVYLEP